ncbi:MAG: histone deacetylase family protein [Patescibacteria group bacterium]|nr:histone deacetylase family protein [Patescibacteria group bacterium]
MVLVRILYSCDHLLHRPRFEFFNGLLEPHAEVPERIENIRKSLQENGFKIESSKKLVPFSLLTQVHDKDYLRFLSQDHPLSYPSLILNSNQKTMPTKKSHSIVKLSHYSFDTYTPVMPWIFPIARRSGSLAYELAEDLVKNRIKLGYALCRPPGHHAQRAKMGGYCYLNNAAIAGHLLSKSAKVAILDLDFHHGNGSQEIFYHQDDVLTISIHAHPGWKFPYTSGFKEEIGISKGTNFNFNFPHLDQVTDQQYQRVLKKALGIIVSFQPQYLVVAFGADTHQEDPIGGFRLTTVNYTQMAKAIKSLNLPTLIIQEGGYNTKLIGEIVVAFLRGFL